MKNLYVLSYSSNNSGGYWWLLTKDWQKMEEAGWYINWKKEDWLGAMAVKAELHIECEDSVAKEKAIEKIREWENITDQNASALGCPCCGQPHRFYLYKVNGEELEGEGSLNDIHLSYSCDLESY